MEAAMDLSRSVDGWARSIFALSGNDVLPTGQTENLSDTEYWRS